MIRHRNKLYVRIPGGEVQYGLISGRLTVWLFGRAYELRLLRGPDEEGA